MNGYPAKDTASPSRRWWSSTSASTPPCLRPASLPLERVTARAAGSPRRGCGRRRGRARRRRRHAPSGRSRPARPWPRPGSHLNACGDGPARGAAGRPAGHLARYALRRAADARPTTAGNRGIPAGQAVAGARPGPRPREPEGGLARGIEWKGELQDRVFVHNAAEPRSPSDVPVLLLDADHDPLIGAATLPVSRRTVIRPRINAEVVQVRDTACSKNKLMRSEARRADIMALARHEAAQGRRVLIGATRRWPIFCAQHWPRRRARPSTSPTSVRFAGSTAGRTLTPSSSPAESSPGGRHREHGPMPVRR